MKKLFRDFYFEKLRDGDWMSKSNITKKIKEEEKSGRKVITYRHDVYTYYLSFLPDEKENVIDALKDMIFKDHCNADDETIEEKINETLGDIL